MGTGWGSFQLFPEVLHLFYFGSRASDWYLTRDEDITQKCE